MNTMITEINSENRLVQKTFAEQRAFLLLPIIQLLTSFEEIAEPLLSQIHNVRFQNQKLRAARDLVLPRLMSGEIQV